MEYISLRSVTPYCRQLISVLNNGRILDSAVHPLEPYITFSTTEENTLNAVYKYIGNRSPVLVFLVDNLPQNAIMTHSPLMSFLGFSLKQIQVIMLSSLKYTIFEGVRILLL